MPKKRPSLRRAPAATRRRSRRARPFVGKLSVTDRHDIFAHELAIHDNATQAARAAGYSATSEESLRVTAMRLRKHPEVVQTLGEIRARRIAKQDLDDQECINHLYETMRNDRLKPRDRTIACLSLLRINGRFGDPIDTRPPVPAFMLPPETPGVSVH